MIFLSFNDKISTNTNMVKNCMLTWFSRLNSPNTLKPMSHYVTEMLIINDAHLILSVISVFMTSDFV